MPHPHLILRLLWDNGGILWNERVFMLLNLVDRLGVRNGLWIMATVGLGAVVASIFMTPWLKLHPCPLCIFQRILYLGFGTLALMGGVSASLMVRSRMWRQGVFAGLALLSLGGLVTALYQTKLQLWPEVQETCGFGEPTPIEILVDWLGERWPDLFLATGLCSSKEWVFLGLSIANWSAVMFAGLFVGTVLFWRHTHSLSRA